MMIITFVTLIGLYLIMDCLEKKRRQKKYDKYKQFFGDRIPKQATFATDDTRDSMLLSNNGFSNEPEQKNQFQNQNRTSIPQDGMMVTRNRNRPSCP